VISTLIEKADILAKADKHVRIIEKADILAKADKHVKANPEVTCRDFLYKIIQTYLHKH
jgi:hypothetical protein